ncbi:alpha/beta hydrolase [Pusillimonas sp. CC-YST705]|uniref:Alpha/beta hydrolase n=1 Tax=Mesopusillimonas faecipullorum TaxID=2755040 RepID=A0ABS8CCB3_9BURK|nr:alpha/beta hydrolase [Mesopusillimonas faecipullorum]MCB5363643.1 alpha/beta hydrolase [Mesopusillimonas faecipullorum]
MTSSSTFLYGANVRANGIRQHYLRYGGKGPALILVPGITSPAPTWGFVAERLGQQYDTYVLDVRGRGLSETVPGMDYSLAACAQDVGAFAQALGLKDYILVGHSMGGRIGALVAANHAEGLSRLVMVDPPVSGPGRRAYPSKIDWYVDSIRLMTAGEPWERLRDFSPTWTDEEVRLRGEWLHTCNEDAIVQSYNEFHTTDMHVHLPQIKVPTMLMVAGKGGVIEAKDIEEIQQLVPGIKVDHVPKAGHMIPWDDLEGFFDSLNTFLPTKV